LIQKIIFTDIDGTILDNTGEYGETPELISSLIKNSIPVILCSAKTLAEQNRVRKQIGLTDPFIVENGGAIVIGKEYFDLSQIMKDYPVKERDGNYIIELGKPATKIREILDEIRKNFNISFRGVADVSIQELSSITRLSTEKAKEMAHREYGETILQIEKSDLDRLTRIARERNLSLIHGGRFFDVTMGNDKGKAVEVLVDLFKKKYDYNVTFFGVGDSENDASMLERMDHPLLVQKYDGSWSNIRVNRIIKVPGIGPKGWALAYNDIFTKDHSK
jgi:mannosyl-3-phosphoglycerate phosphatase family protein